MDNVVRFLVSGPGLVGKQHARLITSRADCVLAGIAAPDIEDNSEFAKGLGVALYPDIEKALDQERVDAVIISSPNEFHFEQTMTCISRRIPALVEKPVTDNVNTARQLAEQSEKAGVPVLVGHHRTYSPLTEAAASFLASPLFGRLVAVQGAALFYKPAKYFEEGIWRTKRGGGPILINLIHEIGLLRHFCGEISAVFALASRRIRGFEVEDTVGVTFEFANGAIGNFLLSDTAASNVSWEMTSGENPSYPCFPEQNCYHFAGTRGSLDFPSMTARYYAEPADASWWTDFATRQVSYTRRNPLELQLGHFIDVVRGEGAPRVSARDGYLNMKVIEAITESISSHAMVQVAA